MYRGNEEYYKIKLEQAHETIKQLENTPLDPSIVYYDPSEASSVPHYDKIKTVLISHAKNEILVFFFFRTQEECVRIDSEAFPGFMAH